MRFLGTCIFIMWPILSVFCTYLTYFLCGIGSLYYIVLDLLYNMICMSACFCFVTQWLVVWPCVCVNVSVCACVCNFISFFLFGCDSIYTVGFSLYWYLSNKVDIYFRVFISRLFRFYSLIKLKDHKDNYVNKSTCRLINEWLMCGLVEFDIFL